jgi:MFS family permease
VRSRVAWALAALTILLVCVDITISSQVVPLFSETAIAFHGFPFLHGAVVGCSLMGALIVSRYERHPIGWLLCLMGTSGSVSLLAEAYAYWVQEADGPGSYALGGVAAWLSTLLGGQLLIGVLALLFLLAPDGHLLSPRWRYAAWLTVAGVVLCFLGIVSTDPTDQVLMTADTDMGAVRAVMVSVGFLAIIGGTLAAVGSLVVRLRRSTAEQRQQLRPILLAAALAAFGLLWLLLTQVVTGGTESHLDSIPLFLSFFALPVLFGVAVLRRRLYELDVIINRTAVVLAATLFAAIGYTILVVAVGSFVDSRTGGFFWSLLATALVAVAFQPVRRRVVRLANRLAYGERAQPYEELATFSSRLVETPSSERLLPVVAAAAGGALSARSTTATLGEQSAVWGAPSAGTDSYAVPVGERGTIEVALPKGRALRSSDRRLLEALADQAAVAFRNITLEDELAAKVEQLEGTTAALARSRARLVEADDAVRRDLEGSLSRDVLPHLAAVQEGLREGTDVEPLINEVNAGLEALRELTRGVFPAQLARGGIQQALRSFPISVDPALAGRRFPSRVEAALYFCCTQTGATAASLTTSGLTLVGVAELAPQVLDRVEAAGGTVTHSGNGVLAVALPDLC